MLSIRMQLDFSIDNSVQLRYDRYNQQRRKILFLYNFTLFCKASFWFRMMVFPFGNISLFNTSHSIDTRPGPVNSRLKDIAINSNSNSYPPTNPFDIFTKIIAPIMSIISNAAAILVSTPIIRAIPPITSKRPIGRTSSGGRPMLPKKPWVPAMSSNFGNPCAINVIPARILIGRGPKASSLCEFMFIWQYPTSH